MCSNSPNSFNMIRAYTCLEGEAAISAIVRTSTKCARINAFAPLWLAQSVETRVLLQTRCCCCWPGVKQQCLWSCFVRTELLRSFSRSNNLSPAKTAASAFASLSLSLRARVCMYTYYTHPPPSSTLLASRSCLRALTMPDFVFLGKPIRQTHTCVPPGVRETRSPRPTDGWLNVIFFDRVSKVESCLCLHACM